MTFIINSFVFGGGGGGGAARSDNFNRANSTTALGTPSDAGSDWSVVAYIGQSPSTFGINSNQAYEVTSTSIGLAVLECGGADGVLLVTIKAIPSGAYGICYRYQNNNNFHYAYYNWASDRLEIRQVNAGSDTQINGTKSWVAAINDQLEVTLSGTSISVRVIRSGATHVSDSVTSSVAQTATKHGIYVENTTSARLDDWSYTP